VLLQLLQPILTAESITIYSGSLLQCFSILRGSNFSSLSMEIMPYSPGCHPTTYVLLILNNVHSNVKSFSSHFQSNCFFISTLSSGVYDKDNVQVLVPQRSSLFQLDVVLHTAYL
jgi:hypothetical protein